MEWLVVMALALFVFALAFSVWYIDRPYESSRKRK